MKADRISIVAMDLDGTLLNRQQKVSEENCAALRACKEQGVHVVLASGRSFESIRTFAVDMEIECGIISCNGARLDASQHGPLIMEDCIPEETAVQVFNLLAESVIYFECYTPGRIYMTDGFVERFHSHEARVMDLDGYRLEYIDSTERMRREALGCAYKFVVYSPDGKVLKQAAERLKALDVSVTSSWHDNVEVMKRGAGKGKALGFYAEQYGVPKEEIMCFGDHLNDLDLLSAAGWPVAMENALDDLKKMARLIAPHHDESGVGKTVRRYVLGGEETI